MLLFELIKGKVIKKSNFTSSLLWSLLNINMIINKVISKSINDHF